MVSNEISRSALVARRKPSSLFDHVDFGEPALGRGVVKPGEEFDHGGAVAEVGLGRGGDLGRGLAGFREKAGIVGPGDFGARVVEGQAHGMGRGLAVEADGAGERGEGGREGVGRGDGDVGAEVIGEVGEFRRQGEEVQRSVVAQDREALDGRRVAEIAAPDVEEPGQAVRQGEDDGALVRLAEDGGDFGAFLVMGFACEFSRVWGDLATGRVGLVGPDAVDEVVGHPDVQPGFFQRLDLGAGVKPGVDADGLARAKPVGEPGAEPGFRPVDGGEVIGGDLVADLKGVAPVDEDPGLVRQDGGKARRAREPGEPGQAFVPGRDVFALMRIRTGDEEGVDPVLFHLVPEGGEPGRALVGGRGGVECLEHGSSV